MEAPKKNLHRVNNAHGTLFGGGASRRIVLLIDCKALVDIAGESDLPAAIAQKNEDIVLGVVRLRNDGDRYFADICENREAGYNHILLQLASAVADADGLARISWGKNTHSSRPWGPFQGLRRRGFSSRSKFQAASGLSNERMNQIVELLWRTASFCFGANSDASEQGELE